MGALLGQILSVIIIPPHQWEIAREDFDKILQQTSPAYSNPKETPLPTEFAEAIIPKNEVALLEQKNFVSAIKNINYDEQIPEAISDYWRAEMTVIRYLKDDLLYVRSVPRYKNNLQTQLKYTKESRKLATQNSDRNEQIRCSKIMYNDIMAWDAKDFESIIRNQGYFQRGIIHTIVDDDEFNWDVGEKDEF